jgi:gliding motility-associated-like protein
MLKINALFFYFYHMKNTTSFYLALHAFVFLFSANVFAQDQPPVVSATGNQVYCPGTSVNIVESFNITDPDDTGTNAIYIQISSGYVAWQDQLSLATSIPNVTTAWNATAGKLTISGVGGQELPYATLINAVNNVVYTSSAANPAGTRTFSITVGEANYLPSTGHYYRFIPNFNITWTAAKTAAETSNYYGLTGYLATLLSEEEAQLCGEQSSGNGWIGGSDSQTEGVWRWMTGPEAGVVFWNGGPNGTTPNYANWNNNEPNNQGDEDYAHITAPGIGVPGSWNDLPNGGGSGGYEAQGYIVEYGGMPGDPVLQISAGTTINMPTVTATTPAERCGGGTLTLSATVSAGTVHWYSAATGGTLLGTDADYTTPAITGTTTYYVSAYPETCTTGTRTAVVATINPIPLPVVTINASTCHGSPAQLLANSPDGTMHWYTQQSGGTEVGTGTVFTTPALTANATYYVEAVSAIGCTSVRIAVNVTVNPVPSVTVANSTLDICGSGTVTLQATPSAGIVNWYDAATGGNLIGTGTTITSPVVTGATSFYAEAEDGGCTSARQAVSITVLSPPAITSATGAVVCDQGTATLSAVAGTGNVNWYDAPTGGSLLFTGPDFTTPVLAGDTTFYAEAITPEGCTAAARTAVTVQVIPTPSVTGVNSPAQYCAGSEVLLEAQVSSGQTLWYDMPTGGNLLNVNPSGYFNNAQGLATVYAAAADNGCESPVRVAVQLIENALPVLGNNLETRFCEGSSLTLDAVLTGVTYLWSNGAATQTVSISQPGEYSVQVTNPSGCTDTQTFTVSMLAAPQIAGVVFTNSSATIEMANADPQDFEYSIDGVHFQASPFFGNLAAGDYTAYARSLAGCGTDEDEFTIYLIPRVVSPNGDNVNDVFTIAGMSGLPHAQVVIMDRYGRLMAQLNRANPRWDGTYNGHPVPATDYWYVIKINAATPEIRGHFALVR